MTETFADRLLREASAQGVTANMLAGLAGTDPSNIYRYLKGMRPIPSLATCFNLVMSLPDTTPATRKWLLDAAILERTSDEWFRYAIFALLATADPAECRRVVTHLRAAVAPDDIETYGVLQDADAVALLMQIAEEPQYAPLRAILAPHIAPRLSIDTARQIVEIKEVQ